MPDVVAANALGLEYFMGETNSVSGGGAFSISATFGAALWLLDYTLRATSVNIKRLYFHHGTIGACAYCWFGNHTVSSPYYGAYVTTAALTHGTHILSLDNGTAPYSSYLIYGNNTPIRALLINTELFDGNGTRSNETFVLNGVKKFGLGDKVRAKRLTAPAATSEQNAGVNPTWGGQWFVNETCEIVGEEVFEDLVVGNGSVEVVLRASEAVLVYF